MNHKSQYSQSVPNTCLSFTHTGTHTKTHTHTQTHMERACGKGPHKIILGILG